MFKATRIRLMALNAIVFFVILACLGILVYADLRQQLYDKVDASLKAKAQSFNGVDAASVFMYLPKVILPPVGKNAANQTAARIAVNVLEGDHAGPAGTEPVGGSDGSASGNPVNKVFQVISGKSAVLNSHTVIAKMPLESETFDPRVFLMLWDDAGNAVPLTNLSGDNQPEIDQFRKYNSEKSAQTLQISGHLYRTFNVAFAKPFNVSLEHLNNNVAVFLNPSTDLKAAADLKPTADHRSASDLKPTAASGDIQTLQVVSVQAIANVDSEQNMLSRLFKLILSGIILGGAAAVAAGFYLANRALRPIRRSWENQQRFVADASHELRMPLSIIQANTELVFRHPDDSILEMSEPLSMVLTEARRMGKLTDQLLMLARTDSNQEELLLKPVLWNELIMETVKKFAPLADLKEIRLETVVEAELGLRGDAEKLTQMLVILLDNSLKYTPEGGTIRIRSHRKGSLVETVLADTGVGIGAQDLPRIFDRFYRGDKARNRAGGGTGLGLAIAQWIVDRHGGTIAAASELGLGTTMTILLPSGPKGAGELTAVPRGV